MPDRRDAGDAALSGEADQVLAGGCACGAIRYTARGPFRPVIGCHCEQCRRWTGHYVAATSVARERLSIQDPQNCLRTWESSPGHTRQFCGACGSSLFWEKAAKPCVSIMAGTLDTPTGLTMTHHIFVDEGVGLCAGHRRSAAACRI